MVDGGTQEKDDWYGDAPLKLQRMIQDDASPKCDGGNASPDEVGEPHSQGNRDSRKCTEPSTPVAEVADAGAPAAVMGEHKGPETLLPPREVNSSASQLRESACVKLFEANVKRQSTQENIVQCDSQGTS